MPFLVFVDAGENLVMVDGVATSSNPSVAPIEQKELEEVPLEVNVSQRPRKEEPSRRVVHTWVDRSAWDHQLSPNQHALTIYLEFVPACEAAPERFEKCQCEDDDVGLHCRTCVPGDGHYRWLQGPLNPLSMEHRAEYLARTIRRILEILQLWSIPLKLLISYNSHEATQKWKLNKNVLGLHLRILSNTSLVLEDYSTNYLILSWQYFTVNYGLGFPLYQ